MHWGHEYHSGSARSRDSHHLIGVKPVGDFNVAWHVILVVFTPQGVSDGAISNRLMTLQDIANAVTNGDAFEVSTPIVFNCSIVPVPSTLGARR